MLKRRGTGDLASNLPCGRYDTAKVCPSYLPAFSKKNEEHNLDIWHASKSFVDVYSPPDEPLLPTELEKLPHTTTTISTTTPKHVETKAEWNGGPLITTHITLSTKLTLS